MKKLVLLFAFFAGLALFTHADASHMAGGDIQYPYIAAS